jgi:ABC-type Fe3+ transport system permease subunit
MKNGAMLLAAMTLVAVTDVLMALRYRQLANRTDSGEAAMPGKVDAAGARTIATFLLIFAPVLFIGAVLVSLGVVPVSGIDPIQF